MMGVNQGDFSQYECTMGSRGLQMMILASLPILALWAHFWLRKSGSSMQTTGAEYEESCWGSIRVIPANVSALWASRGPEMMILASLPNSSFKDPFFAQESQNHHFWTPGGPLRTQHSQSQ